MLHWELTHNRAINQPTAAVSPAAIASADLAQSSNKAQLRAAMQDSSQALLTVPESFQGQVVREAQSIGSEKLVALTFDDGPWTETTEQVLDILRQNNIKATFYWVGLQVQKNPDIARKVVAQGHAIGNHTWRHVLENVDELTAAEEINNTAKLIYDTTGLRTSLFRPPGGNLKGSLASFAQQQKYAVTLWSVESDDYYVSAPIIVDNVLSAVQPGSIVLMHDGGGDRRATVQALPQVISTLQRRGYKFVTVPQLLAAQAQSSITAQIKP
ncbi:polysaccharide deacetylase family protein [Leptolyngbya sp. FACHB-36]|nr:polysaccharide deacetylase family protein [Leptolyngbya sp. FACHB-36]